MISEINVTIEAKIIVDFIRELGQPLVTIMQIVPILRGNKWSGKNFTLLRVAKTYSGKLKKFSNAQVKRMVIKMLIMRVLREQFIENQHGLSSYLQLGPRALNFINNEIPFYITSGTEKLKNNKKLEDYEQMEDSQDDRNDYDLDKVWEIYSQKNQLEEIQEFQEEQQETVEEFSSKIKQKLDSYGKHIEKNESNNCEEVIEEFKKSLIKSLEVSSNNPSLTEEELFYLKQKLLICCSQIHLTSQNNPKFSQIYNLFSLSTVTVIICNLKNSRDPLFSLSSPLLATYAPILLHEIQAFKNSKHMLAELVTPPSQQEISDEQLDELICSLKLDESEEEECVKEIAWKGEDRRKVDDLSEASTPKFKSFEYIHEDNQRSLEQMGKYGGAVKKRRGRRK
jgi:hypothetical protein